MTADAQERAWPLTDLYVYLTSGCNLACRHCWVDPAIATPGAAAPGLDPDLLARVMDEALPLGLGSVKLTGGEPLLHPGIRDVLDRISERDVRLVIETNGTLLDEGLCDRICRTKNRSCP